MRSRLSASIILCTRDRVSGLMQTLGTLGKVRVPSGWMVEVVLVDNGSTDNTAAMVQKENLPNMEVRYFYEAKKGKAHALNIGLAQARGDFILFTDDDVLLEENWLEQIVAPLLNDECDAVTGQITLAPHLLRPWLTPMHRWWLASSHDALPREGVRELIGANMAFRRSVLERVPAFDPELGPGALGLGEDTLFGWQLCEAGFRTAYAPKAAVFHQPHVSRLQRINWCNEALKHGRTEAYLLYHWEHSDINIQPWNWLSCWLKLQIKRLLLRPPPLDAEGSPVWEIGYISRMEFFKQFRIECRRSRNYSRWGLAKRDLPVVLDRQIDPKIQC